jgi:hypothetical protein
VQNGLNIQNRGKPAIMELRNPTTRLDTQMLSYWTSFILFFWASVRCDHLETYFSI